MSRHPSHSMHANSLAAHASIDLGDRERAIVEAYRQRGPMTDRQCAAHMGVGRDYCQPRVSDLIHDHILREVGKTKCEVTGKMVRMVEVVQ